MQVSSNNVHHLYANFIKVILFTYLEALDVWVSIETLSS